MNEDAELLSRYAEEKSEAAFAELVRRHVNFVHAAAWRRVGGDAQLAQEVTQQVFTALAREAGRLTRHPVLCGWMFTATRRIAAQAVRTERRRRAREQAAFIMNEINPTGAPEPDWERLRPELDAVLDQLGERDRAAVLLRFFEGNSFGEIGGRLRLSENAARMCVERALDKMHAVLASRGVSSTTAALGLALTAQAASVAPAGLAAAVTGVALAGGGAAAAGAGAWVTFMSMTKLQMGIAGAVVALGVGGLALQQRTIKELRAEVAELSDRRREIARLHEEKSALLREQNRQRSQAAVEVEKPGPTAASAAEKMRADGSVALAPGLVPVSTLGNGGRATARAAWATQLWAAARGEVDLEAATLIVDPPERAKLEALLATLPEPLRTDYNTPERLMAFVLSGSRHPVGGMRVLSEATQEGGSVVLQTEWQHADDDIVHRSEVELRRDEAGWRMVVPSVLVDRAVGYFRKGATRG